MSDDRRSLADAKFEAWRERTGARDPRGFYRARLRELRDRQPEAYRQALGHFDDRLIPAIVEDREEPGAAWLEFGRVLAQLTTPGETVQIDPSGRRHEYAPPVPLDHLVLHIPTSTRDEVLPVGLPPSLSPAQKATYELLVKGWIEEG